MKKIQVGYITTCGKDKVEGAKRVTQERSEEAVI